MSNNNISIDNCLFITQLNEKLTWVLVESPLQHYSIYAYFLKITDIPFTIKEILENDEKKIVLDCGGILWNHVKFDNKLRPIEASKFYENEKIIEPILLSEMDSFTKDRVEPMANVLRTKTCENLSFIQAILTKKETNENPLKIVFPFELTTDYGNTSEFKNKIRNRTQSFKDLLITFDVLELKELPILNNTNINTFKRKKMSGIAPVDFSANLLDFNRPTHSFVVNTHLHQENDLTPISSFTSSYFLFHINLNTLENKLNFFKFIQGQEDLGFYQLNNNRFEIQNLNQKNNLTIKLKTNNYIGEILIKDIITHKDLLNIESEYLIKKGLPDKNNITIKRRF